MEDIVMQMIDKLRNGELRDIKENPHKMIIGTHDSCAYKLDFTTGFWSRFNKFEILRKLTYFSCFKKRISNLTITQRYNIREQLLMGCRVLDIRVSYKNGVFYTNHTFCCGTLEEMMHQVREFALENYNSTEKIILLIKPDWETRDTILNHENDLLLYLVEKFGNLLQNRDNIINISCYYNARSGEVLGNHPDIHNYNEFDFIWLNVDTVEKFAVKFDEKCKSRGLKNSVLNFVLTPNFSKFTRKLFTTNLKVLASDLNSKITDFIEPGNKPKIILIDFINVALFDDIERYYNLSWNNA